MTFTPGEIKYIWKHRGNKNYLLKAIKAKEETVESLIFDDIKNSYEVSGKILSSPKDGEAYHWPRLVHANLAPLLDILSINETVSIYISTVFEKSLKDTIQEEEFTNRPDCFNRKKSYAEGILWALDYLHGKSLCLMNLNEENIYVSSRNDKAIITDFSCLTLEDRATKSRVVVPTLYRAPELAASSSERFYPKAAEMWACGVLMLQIFSDQVESSFDGDPDKYVLKLVQSLCGILDESSKQGSVEECNAVDEFKIFLDLFLKIDPCSRTTASNAALFSFLRRRKEIDLESGDLCDQESDLCNQESGDLCDQESDLCNQESGDLCKMNLQNPEVDEQCVYSETDVNLLIKPAEHVKDISIKRNARSVVTSEYASDQKKLNNEMFKDSLRNYISTIDAPLMEKEIILDETDIVKSENNSSMSRIANSNAKVISNEKLLHLSMTFNKRKYANISEPIKNSEINKSLCGKNSSNILPHNQDKPTNNVSHPLDRYISDSSINQPNFPTKHKEIYGNEGSTGSWETDTSDSSEDEVYSSDSLEVTGTVSKSKESLSVKETLAKLSENVPLSKMEDPEQCFWENLRNTNNGNIGPESVANGSLEDDKKSWIRINSEADLLDTASSRSLNTSSLPITEQATLPLNETAHQEDLHKTEDLEQCFSENIRNTNDEDIRQESLRNDSLEDDRKSQIRLYSEADLLDTLSSRSLNTSPLHIMEQATIPKNETGHKEDALHNCKFLYRNGETLDSSGKREDIKRKTIFEDEYSCPLLISIRPLHSPIPQKQISTPKPETNGNAIEILVKREQNEFYKPKDSSDVGGVSNSGFDCAVGDFAPSGDTFNNELVEEKLKKRSPSNSAARNSNENNTSEQHESERKSRKWFVNRCGELEPSDIDFFEQPEKKKKKREKSKFEKKSWFYHFCPGCQARGDEVEMLCSLYSA